MVLGKRKKRQIKVIERQGIRLFGGAKQSLKPEEGPSVRRVLNAWETEVLGRNDCLFLGILSGKIGVQNVAHERQR